MRIERLAKAALIAVGCWLGSLAGCDDYGVYGGYDDCIGPDGYNWCIPGGGWDEIHSPTVEPWDFTDW
jgi:hypothetical protein